MGRWNTIRVLREKLYLLFGSLSFHVEGSQVAACPAVPSEKDLHTHNELYKFFKCFLSPKKLLGGFIKYLFLFLFSLLFINWNLEMISVGHKKQSWMSVTYDDWWIGLMESLLWDIVGNSYTSAQIPWLTISEDGCQWFWASEIPPCATFLFCFCVKCLSRCWVHFQEDGC